MREKFSINMRAVAIEQGCKCCRHQSVCIFRIEICCSASPETRPTIKLQACPIDMFPVQVYVFVSFFYRRDYTRNISYSSVNCIAVAAATEILRDFAFLLQKWKKSVASIAISRSFIEDRGDRVVPGGAIVSPYEYMVMELRKLFATFDSPTSRHHSSIRLCFHPLCRWAPLFSETLDNLQFKIRGIFLSSPLAALQRNYLSAVRGCKVASVL